MSSKAISLTPPESLLRQCLVECRDDYIQQASSGTALDLRFTGGWVRDKLLGVQSHDIDVALSTMTGWQFGLQLQQFVEKYSSRYETQAAEMGIKAELGGLHQIAANPEKSKHLETITTRLFGFDIDFVNLRKESYTEDSRNPQMEFGTPEEDAIRRDATVNALFFNLHTAEVEDFTGRGLEDMKQKILRTPLAPYQTFKDDPLRVLRLIRFASRLGYELEADTKAAMKDKSIHGALRSKITRERVGIEIGKMVTGPDPHGALVLIEDLNLFGTVFADPRTAYVPELATAMLRIYDGLQIILSQSRFAPMCTEQDVCWYLAVYSAWGADTTAKVTAAAREGIKASNKLCKILEESVRNKEQIISLVEEVTKSHGATKLARSEIGMAMRGWGASWKQQVLYAMLFGFYTDTGKSVLSRYATFFDHIGELKLEDVVQEAPILNGKQLQKTFGVGAGQWVKKALDMVMRWQLDHPESSAEEAEAMIRTKRTELGLG